MAKELPYFRFTPQEWQNGDVSLESYEIKGLFIDIISYYWIKDCSITLAMLNKRFRGDENLINNLFELEIIKHDHETDYISINFLDEQFDILSTARKRRQEAGSKGGKQKSSNAKAMLKQSFSYKDKDNDKYKDKKTIKNALLSKLNSSDVPHPEYFKIALYWRELFYKFNSELGINNSKSLDNAKYKTWVDPVRLMFEQDKRTKEELREIYDYLPTDDFWKEQIRSTTKLREKFDKLLIKSRSNRVEVIDGI
jgi:hypothetical protein